MPAAPPKEAIKGLALLRRRSYPAALPVDRHTVRAACHAIPVWLAASPERGGGELRRMHAWPYDLANFCGCATNNETLKRDPRSRFTEEGAEAKSIAPCQLPTVSECKSLARAVVGTWCY